MLEKLYNALKYFWHLLGFNAKATTEVLNLDETVLLAPEFDLKRIDPNLNLESIIRDIPALTINEDLFQLDLHRQADRYEHLMMCTAQSSIHDNAIKSVAKILSTHTISSPSI